MTLSHLLPCALVYILSLVALFLSIKGIAVSIYNNGFKGNRVLWTKHFPILIFCIAVTLLNFLILYYGL